MGELCKADLLSPRYLGWQDISTFLDMQPLLGDGFFEAIDSIKLIRIPVHCQLWKFVDSNQNI